MAPGKLGLMRLYWERPTGVATLNASSLVVQNPANAQTSPAADKIPLANGSGKIDNGWLNTGASNGLDADTLDGQHGTYYLAREYHTGTQSASTISDFDTQVRTNRLDQMAAPTATVNLNYQVISNVANPTNDLDAANKNYVDNNSQGIRPKESVKIATTENITLAGVQTIDGVNVIAGDRVLVKDQTDPSENGIYVVAVGVWSRSTDLDTWNELIGSYVFVSQGTINAASGWTANISAGGTLETTAIPFTQFSQAGTIMASNVGSGSVAIFAVKNGSNLEFRTINDTASIDATQTGNNVSFNVLPAGVDKNLLGGDALTVAHGGTGASTAEGARIALGIVGKFSAMLGNGVDTVFTVTHNLGTIDVILQVRKTNAPLAVVEPDLEVVDANSCRISFNVAPSTDQYRVVILG